MRYIYNNQLSEIQEKRPPQWLSPRKKVKKGAHKVLKEPWRIEMVLLEVVLCNSVELLVICWQEEHNKSELKCGAGGRIKELEAPEILVDEFAPFGDKRQKAATVVADGVFKEYTAALREEEVSDISCSSYVSHTHSSCRPSILQLTLLKDTRPLSHLTPTLTCTDLRLGRKRTSIINPCINRKEVVRVHGLMHRGLKVQQYHHQERSIVH